MNSKTNASVRASESGPVEVLAIRYDQLNELLNESEVTREALQPGGRQASSRKTSNGGK